MKQLDELSVDTRKYKTVVDHVFKPYCVDSMKILNKKFDSELGRPAYDRLQGLLIMAFAEVKGEDNPKEISRLCKTDDIFKIITPDRKPCSNTISSFYNVEDDTVFLTVFLSTIMRINDHDFFKDMKPNKYLDSTDALVNSSVNYIISEDEIKALKLMKQWNLLHDLSDKKIRKTKGYVQIKLRQYKNDPEMTGLIGLILKRIKLYNTTVYKKIDKLEESLESNDKNYVPINFPEAVKIPTKRGKWDIGLNCHTVLAENSIILSTILQRKSNDQNSLEQIESELLRNLELLKEIETKYGEKNNITELEKLFTKSDIQCDAGYDGEENNKFIQTSQLNFIVLPKKLAREINKKLRQKNSISSKNNEKFKKDDDYTIKNCERVEDGYICPMGNLIKLINIVRKNNKYNKEKNLPEALLEHDYIHKCSDCENCSYYKKHGEKCSVASYTEKNTPYKYELTNSFVRGDFDETYPRRFPICEGVNGYLKRKKGILNLIGNNLQSANVHMCIKVMVYNLIRFVSLKDSVW